MKKYVSILTEQDRINTKTQKPYTLRIHVAEQHYYNWLRDKIINKEFSSLAEGTGFINLTRIPEILDHTQNLSLDTIYHNYINSPTYKKSTDRDEKNKTKAQWDIFCALNGRSYLEQITLGDVKNYES